MADEEKKLGAEFAPFRMYLSTFKGYLSGDPEVKYFESGNVKTTFSLPLKKSKDDEPVWLNCVAWGKLAENIGENFKKGSQVLVSGYFTETEYEGKTYTNLNVLSCLEL